MTPLAHGHGRGVSVGGGNGGSSAPPPVPPTYRALFHFNNADTDVCGTYGWARKGTAGSYSSTVKNLGSHSLKGAFLWNMNADPLSDRNTVDCGVAGFVRCGSAGAANKQKLHSTYGDVNHNSDT